MAFDLIDVFNAKNGVLSFVGAGGKKTTMFALAQAHPGRVGITVTAHIEFFPKFLQARSYIDDEERLLELIKNDTVSKTITFGVPSLRFGRLAGVQQSSILKFKQAGNFDLMMIKADGARGHFIKAPARHEPPISEYSDIVVPVLSSKVIGMPLRADIAHRMDIIMEITGLKEGEEIRSIHIAHLLTSEKGSLKNTGEAKVIPLINMVDDEAQAVQAKDAAKMALEMTNRFDAVVLAAMKKNNPVVNVVKR